MEALRAAPIPAMLLGAVLGSSIVLSAADLHGTWSASSGGRNFAGTWTASVQQNGAVIGNWSLRDTSGNILMQGGWSASKSQQAWNGAWRATIERSSAEYSGTWTGSISLPPDANFSTMFEAALKAAVSGTWNSAAYSGGWSIRAFP